jgi:hypothetical protein
MGSLGRLANGCPCARLPVRLLILLRLERREPARSPRASDRLAGRAVIAHHLHVLVVLDALTDTLPVGAHAVHFENVALASTKGACLLATAVGVMGDRRSVTHARVGVWDARVGGCRSIERPGAASSAGARTACTAAAARRPGTPARRTATASAAVGTSHGAQLAAAGTDQNDRSRRGQAGLPASDAIRGPDGLAISEHFRGSKVIRDH